MFNTWKSRNSIGEAQLHRTKQHILACTSWRGAPASHLETFSVSRSFAQSASTMALSEKPWRGAPNSALHLGASTLDHFFHVRLFSLFFFAPTPNSLKVPEITNYVCQCLINTTNHNIKIIAKDHRYLTLTYGQLSIT